MFNSRPQRKYYTPDLNREHQLSQGLVYMGFPGDGAVNLVTGDVPLTYQGYSTVATPYGPAAKMAQGTNNALTYMTRNYISAGSQLNTIASLMAPPAVSRVTVPIRVLNGAVTGLIDILVNSTASGGASVGDCSCRWFGSGGSEFGMDIGGCVNGSMQLIAFGRTGSATGVAYINGAQVSSSPTGPGGSGFVAPSAVYACGSAAGDDGATDYPVVCNWIWNRLLAPYEFELLGLNPWQIFHA